MLELLRAKVRRMGLENVEVMQTGILTYDHVGEPADIVYSRYALHHLPDAWKAVALTRLRSLLRSGGVLWLWDVVYNFAPEEAETRLEAWCATGATGVTAVERLLVRGGLARSTAGETLLDLLVLGLAIVGVVRVWAQPVEPRLTVTALALLATLPLLLRRRLPLAAPLTALVIGCLGLSVVVPGALWEQLQFFFYALLCAWFLGSENPRARALVGLGAVVVVAIVAVALDPVHSAVGDYVFGVAITTAAWTGGVLFGLGSRQAAAAERERRDAEAIAAERARIPRELHDVVAHSVSVMVVQAGAAEQVLGPGHEQVAAALQAIRDSGKGALVELRLMLGMLRDDEPEASIAPQPRLADVDGLVGQVAAAGVHVDRTTFGQARPLPPGLEQASYRILQEAVTNTLKHAGPARATVDIRWDRTRWSSR